MVTLGWGYSFAWVVDFKIADKGRFTIGYANNPNALLGLCFVVNESNDNKMVFAAALTTTLNSYSAITKDYEDGLWHRLLINVKGDMDNRRIATCYIDSPEPLLSVVAENPSGASNKFAIGRRGAGADASSALNWWGDGYARNLLGYDRALSLSEILRVLAA